MIALGPRPHHGAELLALLEEVLASLGVGRHAHHKSAEIWSIIWALGCVTLPLDAGSSNLGHAFLTIPVLRVLVLLDFAAGQGQEQGVRLHGLFDRVPGEHVDVEGFHIAVQGWEVRQVLGCVNSPSRLEEARMQDHAT